VSSPPLQSKGKEKEGQGQSECGADRDLHGGDILETQEGREGLSAERQGRIDVGAQTCGLAFFAGGHYHHHMVLKEPVNPRWEQ